MMWGLFAIAAANIFPRLFKIPNAIRGFLLVLGLVLQITALVQMAKARKKNSSADSGK